MIVYIYIGFWVISFDDCYKTLDFFVLSFNFINDNKYSCTVHLDLYMQIYDSVQTKHQQMCNKCYTKRTTNGAGTSYFWGAPVFSPAFGQVFPFVCIVLWPVVCRLVRFLWAIVLSARLRFTASGHPFDIWNLFASVLRCYTLYLQSSDYAR